MFKSGKRLSLGIAFTGAGILLAGCNPATTGWAAKDGQGISYAGLVSAQQQCNYRGAQERTLKLIDRSVAIEQDDPKEARVMKRRAATVITDADQCMKRYGFYRQRESFYAVGSKKKKKKR